MKDEIDTRNTGPKEGPTSASSSFILHPLSFPKSFILHPSSFLKWIVLISRFGLAGLFLFTAIAKIAFAKTFAANVSQLLDASGFSGTRWNWSAAIAVVILEITAALLLLLRRTARLGALLAAILLVGFAGYALYYVYVLHGEPLECGCFGGIIASQLGVKTALRNLVLLIPALIVMTKMGRTSEA